MFSKEETEKLNRQNLINICKGSIEETGKKKTALHFSKTS
jgi:hypothetical protein